MKKIRTFKVGDKVFAKVKGYPAWPAIIMGDIGKKYSVRFYGTGEMGYIKPEDLFLYEKYKTQFNKVSKKKEFHDALNEIEAAVNHDNINGQLADDGDETSTDSNDRKRKRSTPDPFEEDMQTIKKMTLLSGQSMSIKEEVSDETCMGQQAASEKVDDASSPTPEMGVFELKKEETTQEISILPEPENRDYAVKSEEEEDEDDVDKEPNEHADDASVNANEVIDDYEDGNNSEVDAAESRSTYSNITALELCLIENIVLDYDLYAAISYANYVKDKEDFFRAMPIEPRDIHKNQVIIVSNIKRPALLGIRLYPDWPIECENEFEQAVYEEKCAINVLNLKKSIDDGSLDVSPGSELDPNLFMDAGSVSVSDMQSIIDAKATERKLRILDRLNVEVNMVELDVAVKNSLSLEFADTKKALCSLDSLLALKRVDRLMLMKHHHIVSTFKSLRKYVGNVEDWDLDEPSLQEFQIDADKIRKRAELLCDKLKDILSDRNDNETTIWNNFQEMVERFQEECKDLTEQETFILCDEPYSRRSIMDRLEYQRSFLIQKTSDSEQLM